jgi:chromosome partitioning protein
MHVLALASQKGGSGKTTLSGHLAVEAERTGAGPVALIDMDSQGSLSEWWNARSAARPYFAKAALSELGSALEELEEAGVRLVVLDTPPAITESISRVIGYADLVLVPTRPSPHDLRAVGATVEIAEHHGKPVVFVMNAATARARITAETAVALSQHGTVAPVMIHQRVDFAASMVDGRTVGEVMPESPSAKEVCDLWNYVRDRLARIAHEDVQRAPSRLPEHILSAAPPAPEPDVVTVSSVECPPVAAQMDVDVQPAPDTAEAATDLGAAQQEADRRSGSDRRKQPSPSKPFSAGERRVHPFGRRQVDRPVAFTGASK